VRANPAETSRHQARRRVQIQKAQGRKYKGERGKKPSAIL